jgi:hypothetical protein
MSADRAPTHMKLLYRASQPYLVFKWGFDHFGQAAKAFGRGPRRENAMLHIREFSDIGKLTARLRNADEVDAALINEAIGAACRRYPSPGQADKTARLTRLIQSGAWTDAALALIDLELPMWQVRRLAYDDGEWHCALSRERELPDWLDEATEARHADLALAILCAFVEARRVSAPESRRSVPDARGYSPDFYETLPIDNYV